MTQGEFDRGLALMERGFAKGVADEKRPQDARLHLGIAYYLAGKRERAIEVFREVRGIHGAADMGRLWAIQTRSEAKL